MNMSNFQKPLIDDFYAALRPISDDRLTKFIAMINKSVKPYKIEADVKDCKNNGSMCLFTGEYVVLLMTLYPARSYRCYYTILNLLLLTYFYG